MSSFNVPQTLTSLFKYLKHQVSREDFWSLVFNFAGCDQHVTRLPLRHRAGLESKHTHSVHVCHRSSVNQSQTGKRSDGHSCPAAWGSCASLWSCDTALSAKMWFIPSATAESWRRQTASLIKCQYLGLVCPTYCKRKQWIHPRGQMMSSNQRAVLPPSHS